MRGLTDKQMGNISELMISTLLEGKRRRIIDNWELKALEQFSVSGVAAVAVLEELRKRPRVLSSCEVIN